MKTALITGGSRGIGAATARTLARAGCAVAINYHHSRREAEALAAELEAEGADCLARTPEELVKAVLGDG